MEVSLAHCLARCRHLVEVPEVTRRLKGATAMDCNGVLGRAGMPFWQHEGYHRLVRSPDELLGTSSGILSLRVWRIFGRVGLKPSAS